MIKAYVKYQRKLFLCVIVAVIVFSLCEYLFNIKTIDIAYSVLLYLFVIFTFLIFDYIHFIKKYKGLIHLHHNLSIDRKSMPKADNPIEENYTKIIHELYQEIGDTIYEIDKQTKENVEYYTLWIHQIKTPISAMHFVLQNMEEIPQKVTLELELFKIEQYVELALQFIKIGNIESDLVIHQYSLKEMIHQSVRKYSDFFIHKGLGVNVSDCDALVTTDSKWFAFILEQILSNAIKYTQKGIIQIYARQEPEGTYLTIEDTGIGIKKEDIKRVFEKGYTGFNGRLDKKASGIGLYLVKKVSLALNHQITIESFMGKGTKVHIFIKNYQ